MLDMIRQFAGKPGHGEKVALAADLRQTVAEGLAAPGGEPATCPHCGCTEFVRRGRDARGAQRYLCRGCARSFTARSRGLLARSKLAASQWMDFAQCLADALTLRECAERCGTCLRTAWFMRHRACEVMASRLEPFRAVGEVQVDGNYLDLFCYREQFRGSDGDARERIYRHECDGTYQTSRKGYVGMPIPFPRYWELAA